MRKFFFSPTISISSAKSVYVVKSSAMSQLTTAHCKAQNPRFRCVFLPRHLGTLHVCLFIPLRGTPFASVLNGIDEKPFERRTGNIIQVTHGPIWKGCPRDRRLPWHRRSNGCGFCSFGCQCVHTCEEQRRSEADSTRMSTGGLIFPLC